MLAGQQTQMWKEIQEQPAALRRTLDDEEQLLELATIPLPLTLPSISDKLAQGAGVTMSAKGMGSKATSIAELLAPFPYIIPGQLFAHYLALYKGLNPDQPRGLTKITRTR